MIAAAHTPFGLADLAGCASPDAMDSAGACFLAGIQDSWNEYSEDGSYDDDTAHAIADSAVPVYTHELWQTFVDLAAYDEDPTELGEDGSDMTRSAGACLYLIATRLVYALQNEREENDDE